MDCIHSTFYPLNVYIPQVSAVENTHSMTSMWNVYIPHLTHWMYTFHSYLHSMQHICNEYEYEYIIQIYSGITCCRVHIGELYATFCILTVENPPSWGVKCNFTKQPVHQHRLINLYNLHELIQFTWIWIYEYININVWLWIYEYINMNVWLWIYEYINMNV